MLEDFGFFDNDFGSVFENEMDTLGAVLDAFDDSAACVVSDVLDVNPIDTIAGFVAQKNYRALITMIKDGLVASLDDCDEQTKISAFTEVLNALAGLALIAFHKNEPRETLIEISREMQRNLKGLRLRLNDIARMRTLRKADKVLLADLFLTELATIINVQRMTKIPNTIQSARDLANISRPLQITKLLADFIGDVNLAESEDEYDDESEISDEDMLDASVAHTLRHFRMSAALLFQILSALFPGWNPNSQFYEEKISEITLTDEFQEFLVNILPEFSLLFESDTVNTPGGEIKIFEGLPDWVFENAAEALRKQAEYTDNLIVAYHSASETDTSRIVQELATARTTLINLYLLTLDRKLEEQYLLPKGYPAYKDAYKEISDLVRITPREATERTQQIYNPYHKIAPVVGEYDFAAEIPNSVKELLEKNIQRTPKHEYFNTQARVFRRKRAQSAQRITTPLAASYYLLHATPKLPVARIKDLGRIFSPAQTMTAQPRNSTEVCMNIVVNEILNCENTVLPDSDDTRGLRCLDAEAMNTIKNVIIHSTIIVSKHKAERILGYLKHELEREQAQSWLSKLQRYYNVNYKLYRRELEHAISLLERAVSDINRALKAVWNNQELDMNNTPDVERLVTSPIVSRILECDCATRMQQQNRYIISGNTKQRAAHNRNMHTSDNDEHIANILNIALYLNLGIIERGNHI